MFDANGRIRPRWILFDKLYRPATFQDLRGVSSCKIGLKGARLGVLTRLGRGPEYD